MRALREVLLTARVLSGQGAALGCLMAMFWSGTTFLRDSLPSLAALGPGFFPVFAVCYVVVATISAADFSAAQPPLLLPLPVRWPARVVGVTLVAVATQILLTAPLFLLTHVAPDAIASAILRVARAFHAEHDPVRDLAADLVVLGPTGPTLATLFAPHALARMTLHTAGAVSVTASARGASHASALSLFVGLAFGLLDLGGPELWRPCVVLGVIPPLLVADAGVRWGRPSLDAFARPVRGVRPVWTGWRAVAGDAWESHVASIRATGSFLILGLAAIGGLITWIVGLEAWAAIPWLVIWGLPAATIVMGWSALLFAPLFTPAGASRIFPTTANRGSDLPGLPLLPMSRSRWIAGATLQGLVAPVAMVAGATWALHRFAGREVDGSSVAQTAFFATTLLTAQFALAWRSQPRIWVHEVVLGAVLFGALVLTDRSGAWVAMVAAGPPLAALFGLSVFAVLRGGR